MTTKIRPTNYGKWVVYETADSDCPEVEIAEFDTQDEAKDWLDDFNRCVDADTDDINDATYG